MDDTKERLSQIINTETRQSYGGTEILALDELWLKLLEQEEKSIADYLSVGIEEISSKDALKEKIDALLDLELNLKAREVLVKVLYEKGYKAYKS